MLGGLAAMVAGCGGSSEREPGSTGPAQASDAATPKRAAAEPSGEAEGAVPEAVSEADLAAVTAALTQAVRRYGIEQRQVPASLEDLVARGYLGQLPEPPRGRRFVIDKQLQVQLVKE